MGWEGLGVEDLGGVGGLKGWEGLNRRLKGCWEGLMDRGEG